MPHPRLLPEQALGISKEQKELPLGTLLCPVPGHTGTIILSIELVGTSLRLLNLSILPAIMICCH